MIDEEKFIGLPYRDHGRGPEAYDCWGLVRLVYERCLGIALPSYVDGYKSASWDTDGIALLVKHERQRWTCVSIPSEGDVVVLRVSGRPQHVGVVLTGNRMLHTLSGHDSAVESLASPKWSRRVEGFYHYAR